MYIRHGLCNQKSTPPNNGTQAGGMKRLVAVPPVWFLKYPEDEMKVFLMLLLAILWLIALFIAWAICRAGALADRRMYEAFDKQFGGEDDNGI